LKKPVLEAMQPLTSAQIKRINNLLNFLIKIESTAILDRRFCYMKSLIDNNLGTEIAGADMELLHMNMDNARDILYQKLQRKGCPLSRSFALGGGSFCRSQQNDLQSVVPSISQVRMFHMLVHIDHVEFCL
jgi:hypothetical protein